MNSAHLDSFVRDRLPPAEALPEFRFELPELQYPERLNAAVELIDRADPARLAVINDAGSWTYGAMRDLSDRIARLLAEEEGLVPGNRVLLRGPNTATMFAAWLGVLKAGGIVVATMPALRAGEIATIVERAAISHAIVDGRTRADFEAACGGSTIRSALYYEGDSLYSAQPEPVEGFAATALRQAQRERDGEATTLRQAQGEREGGASESLEARLATAAPGFMSVPTHRDDPALIAFTSGTTGIPKGCVHYHRDILAPADSFARHILEPSPDDRWACSAPIAFTFGLGMLLIFPWRFGGAAVTIETPGPGPLLDAIERHRVTTLATAPTAYKALLGALDGRDISSLATCVSAGEHLPAATWHAWKEATGIGIVDGIGATEMMHIFISAAGDEIRPGATGKAVPGYRACVLGEDGRPLTEGTGRLAVKGPTGCRYFDDPRQADYVIHGWNVTGDTYRADADGYFWFVARSDDMIVSSGYNIAAPEVENALYAHPAVAECAVVGLPCEERGQRVTAYVVLAQGYAGDDALADALKAHVKATIAPYKYPRAVIFAEALPRTATGKLQRFALRDLPAVAD